MSHSGESLSERIDNVVLIAREAGELAMKIKAEGHSIEHKGTIDLVNEADKESEKHIVTQLNQLYPEDSIVAEEGFQFEGSSGLSWIIDPLDGTTSFAHGFPFFCISIGLVDQNKTPVLGVVYSPMLNEIFTAARGEGARLNGTTIHVSQVTSLSGALMGTGFPYYRRKVMGRLLERLGGFLQKVHDVRRTGSAALDLAYVACGRLDFYYEEGLQPWDTAGAIVVLTEAGGKVSKFDGSPFDLFIPEILASNDHVHQEALEQLNS